MRNSSGHPVDCPACRTRPEPAGPYWLFRCPSCGLLISTLEAEISATQSETLIDEERRMAALGGVRSQSAAAILEGISALRPGRPTRLLDVGCGFGVFLREAAARGYAAVGIDPDGNVVETARRLSSADVRQAHFPDGLAASETFGAITFNDVLEHIQDVDAVLGACRDRLEEGGLLVVTCPDQGGIFYRAAALMDRLGIDQPLRRLWQFGYPSPHVFYFAPRHLELICKRHGLALVRSERLMPLLLASLWKRISYARDQSLAFNIAAMIAVSAAYPLILLLPRDQFTLYFVRTG